MRKKTVISIMIIIASLAAVALITSFRANDYVLKIGDIEVSEKEYMVYFYEQKKHFEETGGTDIWETDIDGVAAEDLAKQYAVDTISDVKTALSQADKFSIKLSDEELENVSKEAETFYKELIEAGFKKFGVTYDDVYKIISEGKIRTKTADYITSGFTVNEQEFNEYFDEYFELNKADLIDMKLKYIYKSAGDKQNPEQVYSQMEEIYNKAKNGEDFSALINQYSEIDEKGEISMKKGLFEPNVEKAVCEITEKDSLTNIIEASNGFYIFYITDVSPIDKESIKEAERENYISRKKEELYRRQSEKWQNDFPVEKNNEFFSSLKIEDFADFVKNDCRALPEPASFFEKKLGKKL